MIQLSASAVKAYLRCKTGYYVRYVLKIRPEQTYYGRRGSIYHAVVENLHKYGYSPQQTFHELGLTDAYGNVRDEYLIEVGGVLKWLLNYPYKNHTILHTEWQFDNVPIGRAVFRGMVDQIQERDTGIAVVDFKTEAAMSTYKRLEEDPQYQIYALAYRSIYGVLPDNLIYCHARTGKERSITLREGWEERLIHLVDEICTFTESGQTGWTGEGCSSCEHQCMAVLEQRGMICST